MVVRGDGGQAQMREMQVSLLVSLSLLPPCFPLSLLSSPLSPLSLIPLIPLIPLSPLWQFPVLLPHSTTSDDDDISVLRRCPAELLDEVPFDTAWAIPGAHYRLLREVTDQLEYDVVKRQGITNVLEKLSIAACSAVERRIASYYAAGQASFLTPTAPLLSLPRVPLTTAHEWRET